MVFAEKPFNPESSTMDLNLVVKGQQWEPPMPVESWNNGQFTLVMYKIKLYFLQKAIGQIMHIKGNNTPVKALWGAILLFRRTNYMLIIWGVLSIG